MRAWRTEGSTNSFWHVNLIVCVSNEKWSKTLDNRLYSLLLFVFMLISYWSKTTLWRNILQECRHWVVWSFLLISLKIKHVSRKRCAWFWSSKIWSQIKNKVAWISFHYHVALSFCFWILVVMILASQKHLNIKARQLMNEVESETATNDPIMTVKAFRGSSLPLHLPSSKPLKIPWSVLLTTLYRSDR